ncbi:hypothetical protein KC19_2G038500 [Ceratodon purpureus]|uniref:Uncharacterized protein n=1 Tax=Ceratodon purpureus TaxID=3225 RepID=A0A8T0ISN0_CERPU|nr:hypothetical protein KC19_2G038500 [Ceratodon purpureus]
MPTSNKGRDVDAKDKVIGVLSSTESSTTAAAMLPSRHLRLLPPWARFSASNYSCSACLASHSVVFYCTCTLHQDFLSPNNEQWPLTFPLNFKLV